MLDKSEGEKVVKLLMAMTKSWSLKKYTLTLTGLSADIQFFRSSINQRKKRMKTSLKLFQFSELLVRPVSTV